jgi:hypothetical protein
VRIPSRQTIFKLKRSMDITDRFAALFTFSSWHNEVEDRNRGLIGQPANSSVISIPTGAVRCRVCR